MVTSLFVSAEKVVTLFDRMATSTTQHAAGCWVCLRILSNLYRDGFHNGRPRRIPIWLLAPRSTAVSCSVRGAIPRLPRQGNVSARWPATGNAQTAPGARQPDTAARGQRQPSAPNNMNHTNNSTSQPVPPCLCKCTGPFCWRPTVEVAETIR